MFKKFKIFGKFIKKNTVKICTFLFAIIFSVCYFIVPTFAVTSFYPKTIFEDTQLFYDTLIGDEELPDVNQAYLISMTNDSNKPVVNGLFMDTNSFNNLITEDSYRVVSCTLKGVPVDELKVVNRTEELFLEFSLSVGFNTDNPLVLGAGNLLGLSNNPFDYFQFRTAYLMLNVTDSTGTRNITHPLSVSYNLVNTAGNENIFGAEYEFGNSPIVNKVVCGLSWKPDRYSTINSISIVMNYGQNEFYDGLFVNSFYLQFQNFKYDINNSNSNIIGSESDKFYNDINGNYDETLNELVSKGQLTGNLIEEFDAFKLNRFNRSFSYISSIINRVYESSIYIKYMYWSSIFIGVAAVLLGVLHAVSSNLERRKND